VGWHASPANFLFFSKITVFVFLRTFEPIALLLKSFHLHLHVILFSKLIAEERQKQ